jgi:WhiB family redox-sensing transcriptional regulator
MQGIVFTTPVPKIEEALCANNEEVGPDDFFPAPRGFTADNKKARALCKVCPGIEDCLKFALDNNIVFGIWGGTVYRERLAIKQMKHNG